MSLELTTNPAQPTWRASTSQETGTTQDFGSCLQAIKVVADWQIQACTNERCEAELTLPLIEVHAKDQENPVLLHVS